MQHGKLPAVDDKPINNVRATSGQVNNNISISRPFCRACYWTLEDTTFSHPDLGVWIGVIRIRGERDNSAFLSRSRNWLGA